MEGSIVLKSFILLFSIIENSIIYKKIKSISLFIKNIIINSFIYKIIATDFNMLEKWRTSYIGKGFYNICNFFWNLINKLISSITYYSSYSILIRQFKFPYSVISKNLVREHIALILGVILLALGDTSLISFLGIALIIYISLFKIEKGIYTIGFLIPFVNSTYLTILVIGLSLSFVLKTRKVSSLKIEPYFLLFFIFLFGSVLTSPVKSNSFTTFILYLIPIIYGYILIFTLNNKEKLFKLFKINVLAGVVQSVYALLQYKFGISMGGTWVDVEEFGEITTRAMGTLGNPNVLAEYLVIVIILGCILLLVEKSLKSKLVYGISTGIMLAGLAVTYSRGGYLSFLFAVFIFLVLIDRRLVVLFGIGALGAIVAMPGLILKRFSSITNLADSSNAYRISIWIGTLDLIRSNLIKGTGLGLVAFSNVYEYFVYGSAMAVHSHNLILQITAEMGIFGIITFFIFVAALIKWALISSSNFKDKKMTYVVYGLIGALGAHMLHGFVDYVWYDPRILFMFWSLVGMLICSIVRGQEDSYCD